MTITDFITPGFNGFDNLDYRIFSNQYKTDYIGVINFDRIYKCNTFKNVYFTLSELFTENSNNYSYINLLQLYTLIMFCLITYSIYKSYKERKTRNRINTIMNFLSHHGLLNTNWQFNILYIIAYCLNNEDNGMSSDEYSELIEEKQSENQDNKDSNNNDDEESNNINVEESNNNDEEYNNYESDTDYENDIDNDTITYSFTDLLNDSSDGINVTTLRNIIDDKNILTIIKIILDNMTLEQLEEFSTVADNLFIKKLINYHNEDNKDYYYDDTISFTEKEIYAFASLVTIYRRYLGLPINNNSSASLQSTTTKHVSFTDKFNNPIEPLVNKNKLNVSTLSKLNEFIENTDTNKLVISIYYLNELIISNNNLLYNVD